VPKVFALIGLGSNLGDTANNLRRAVGALRNLKNTRTLALSPFYESKALLLPDSPPDWQLPFLNTVALLSTELEPVLLLSELKKIESNFGRCSIGRYAPRPIDLDILFYDSSELISSELCIPHPEIGNRPFVYLPLKDLREHFRSRLGSISTYLEESLGRFDNLFAKRNLRDALETRLADEFYSQIVGICNVTNDSFSADGVLGLCQEERESKLRILFASSDIVDIGAESTRPGGKKISVEEEKCRLNQVLDSSFVKKSWSLDSRNIETINSFLLLKPKIINDVSAEIFPHLVETFNDKESSICYCFMHSLSLPVDKNETISKDSCPIKQLINWGEEKLDKISSYGFTISSNYPNQFIFDPGIGFGKTAQQSWELLRRIREFRALNVPLYVGLSRKSFLCFDNLIKADASNEVKDSLSAQLSFNLFSSGVEYLRTHNPQQMRLAQKAWVLSDGVVEF
jgi:2-amino-4-hydroxy-6-hydroxymethyldihydropteridine diphosphokinase / dihydropteroate synthase